MVVEVPDEVLLVDVCRRLGAGVVVKGVRDATDVAHETPMAVLNREMADVETVLLPADPRHAAVSSSLVRAIAEGGGDVTPYVPAVVAQALRERLAPAEDGGAAAAAAPDA